MGTGRRRGSSCRPGRGGPGSLCPASPAPTTPALGSCCWLPGSLGSRVPLPTPSAENAGRRHLCCRAVLGEKTQIEGHSDRGVTEERGAQARKDVGDPPGSGHGPCPSCPERWGRCVSEDTEVLMRTPESQVLREPGFHGLVTGGAPGKCLCPGRWEGGRRVPTPGGPGRPCRCGL